MGVRIVTQPTEEPLSLDEVKAHLRVDGAEEDALLSHYLQAARLTAERQCWRQIAKATLEWSIDCFPADECLFIPRPPLISITSIKYVDPNADTQTFDPVNYYVDPLGEPGRVVLKSGSAWPVTNLQPGSVLVRYEAGYADAASVPADLKTALLLLVGHLYENREAVLAGAAANELPFGVDALLTPHRFRDVRVTDQL